MNYKNPDPTGKTHPKLSENPIYQREQRLRGKIRNEIITMNSSIQREPWNNKQIQNNFIRSINEIRKSKSTLDIFPHLDYTMLLGDYLNSNDVSIPTIIVIERFHQTGQVHFGLELQQFEKNYTLRFDNNTITLHSGNFLETQPHKESNTLYKGPSFIQDGKNTETLGKYETIINLFNRMEFDQNKPYFDLEGALEEKKAFLISQNGRKERTTYLQEINYADNISFDYFL